MKIILLLFLYITIAKCGVIKDVPNESDAPDTAACNQIEAVVLIGIKDFVEIKNIIDTIFNFVNAKDKESNKGCVLSPGSHHWEIKFMPNEQTDKINHVLSIVDAANKSGQLVGKNCTTVDDSVMCNFNIYVDATYIHKRDTEAAEKKTEEVDDNNSAPKDEINRLLIIVEDAATKSGQLIDKNCTTVDGSVICNFNIQADDTNQPLLKMYKRDIEIQNNTNTTDAEVEPLLSIIKDAENQTGIFGTNCTKTDSTLVCNVFIPNESYQRDNGLLNSTLHNGDEIKLIFDSTNTAKNTDLAINTAANCTTVDCMFSPSEAFVGGCPDGKERADDNTCVDVI